MPVLQPAEPWRKTGRIEIEELFKLTDRKGSELVLAMTHEEAVTFHVAQIVRSYRDLPLILYHFQVKERDEPRPRAGVLRTREFIMKDSYTFDRDQAGMEENYALHVGAYDRMMDRTGLRWYRVEGDVGMMGGLGAHEYMAPCAAGEDEVVLGRGLRRQRGDRAAAARRCEQRRAMTTPTGEQLTVEPAIEIGNIFKLGTRYSEPLGAALSRRARAPSSRSGWPPTGSARRGSWRRRSSSSPTSTASPGRARSLPSPCTSSGSASRGRPSATPPSASMSALAAGGIDTLYDDRELGPGEKFADAELLGCPLRLTVGRRSIESGEIEVQVRRGRVQAPGIPLAGEPEGWSGRWTSCGGASRRREPTEDRPGRPEAFRETPLQRPYPRGRTRWAPPDVAPAGGPGPLGSAAAADAGRTAAAPVDDPQRDRVRAARADPRVPGRRAVELRRHRRARRLALFAVIGWGDYADGIAARLTRQYSRLGTLMDPITDRLLVISGVVVCWDFQLLPRWALAVLVARELTMLALGRYGQTHGVELRINWPGRIGVGPLMASFFFAMAGLHTLGEVLLYVGLALALSATVLYARSGLTQLREAP